MRFHHFLFPKSPPSSWKAQLLRHLLTASLRLLSPASVWAALCTPGYNTRCARLFSKLRAEWEHLCILARGGCSLCNCCRNISWPSVNCAVFPCILFMTEPICLFCIFCLLWRNGTNDSSWELIWQPGIELIDITVRYYWDCPRIAITTNIFLYCF